MKGSSKIWWLACAGLMGVNLSVQANVDPSSLKVKVYEVWVSASGTCSDPIKVIDNGDNPDYIDFLAVNPTLGGGGVDDGTYPCVIIMMSDLIKFKPSANDGSRCVAGTEYTLDVCRSDAYTKPDGTSGNCNATTGVHDLVPLYLSTFATGAGSSWLPPTAANDSTRGFNLPSALVVSGTTTSEFIVDGVQSPKLVLDNGSICEMNAPSFSFR